MSHSPPPPASHNISISTTAQFALLTSTHTHTHSQALFRRSSLTTASTWESVIHTGHAPLAQDPTLLAVPLESHQRRLFNEVMSEVTLQGALMEAALQSEQQFTTMLTGGGDGSSPCPGHRMSEDKCLGSCSEKRNVLRTRCSSNERSFRCKHRMVARCRLNSLTFHTEPSQQESLLLWVHHHWFLWTTLVSILTFMEQANPQEF